MPSGRGRRVEEAASVMIMGVQGQREYHDGVTELTVLKSSPARAAHPSWLFGTILKFSVPYHTIMAFLLTSIHFNIIKYKVLVFPPRHPPAFAHTEFLSFLHALLFFYMQVQYCSGHKKYCTWMVQA